MSQSHAVRLRLALIALGLLAAIAAPIAGAACRDAVVLVHGNSGDADNWVYTYQKLRANGYAASEIQRPEWGSKWCSGTCNDHYGSEEYPVRDALSAAVASSCTGKIDVIAHSMGVTLAAQQIYKLGIADKVDTFVGIAGGMRGLNSCGSYSPWYWWKPSTCGKYGLSKGSTFLNWLHGQMGTQRLASKIYSIKSYNDELVCAGGWAFCYIDGTHTSNIPRQNASHTLNHLGHFGLQRYTPSLQYDLIN